MRFLKWLIVFLIVILILGIAKNVIIQKSLEFTAQKILGVRVKMETLSFSILRHMVSIKGLKVYQPQHCPAGVMLDLPEISVQYDLRALLRKEIYLKEVVFDLKEAVIMKDKEGNLCVNSLKIFQKKEGEMQSETPAQPEAKAEPLQFHIDLLKLNLGRVVQLDYTNKDKPATHVYELNIKKEFAHVDSVEQLSKMVVFEVVKVTAFKSAIMYGTEALLGVAAFPVGIAAAVVKSGVVEDIAGRLPFGGHLQQSAQENTNETPQKTSESEPVEASA